MNIITDNLNQIIDAPDGIKRLRELILQLAVQGKLVEQRPEEGTAADLLKQIAKAKAADQKKRKANGERIATPKPLPPITQDEIPFEIPDNWEWVKIGSTMNLINGMAFKPSDWTTTGLPIVRIQNLNNISAPFNRCNAKVNPRVLLSTNDFLISWSGTPGTSFGAFIWERGPALLNQHIFKCHLYGVSYLKTYLRIAINSRLDEMISQAHGAVGLRHITKGKLENMCITLPPLAEQKRIVAKVDELMKWCDELEALKQQREQLRKAALQSALIALTSEGGQDAATRIFDNFAALIRTPEEIKQLRDAILQLAVQGKLVEQCPADGTAADLLKQIAKAKAADQKQRKANGERVATPKPLPPITQAEIPFEIPDNWEWVRLGDLGPIVGGGTPRSHIPEYYSENGIPWITPADMRILSGKFVSQGRRDISESGLLNSSAQLMPAGTILFSSRAPIGYVAIASNPIATNQGFKSCVPIIKQTNEFLYYFLKHAGKEIDLNASGTTFREVSGAQVAIIKLPLPPLPEQKRIVAKVDELMQSCDELEELLKHESETAARFAAAVAQCG